MFLVHVHSRLDAMEGKLDNIERKLDRALVLLSHLTNQEETELMDLKGISDKLAALQAQVEEETTVDKSIETLVTGLAATIADLKAQLAAAIAANDPVALQAVADGLDHVSTTLASNVQGIKDNVTANTPAE